MTQLMNDERHDGGEAEFPVGSWEHPDPAGIVRRGEAATRVRRTAEKFGQESQVCSWVPNRVWPATGRP